MKKILIPLLLCIMGSVACQHQTHATVTDTDSTAIDSAVVDTTVTDSVQNTLTTWLVAGMTEDAEAKMFILEGKEGRMVIQKPMEGDEVLLLLRLVSYTETFNTLEGTEENFGGPLVVNAYDPKTNEFLGQYSGEYHCFCLYDDNMEDMLHGAESYSGTFVNANGIAQDFSFYGD